ncbi:DUF2637 domain-containing protein [Pseudonocardia bannensis]|uniref:DUF2637 domain-containing protein n=1 Tax=Pseudonocardia bannensis TaxID=630973 RepID=A0A848DGH0_9PSEU|nr:DUF2637 domain-containing protein [Pseudonocardia bannensis]NMH91644.1 DUF2637 domain-containing protein [Pseudonocardia bannensis]
MTARSGLCALLLIVAAAAAVLSFAALRDLALVCGFAAWPAWLLPVVVDAGAAAGSLVWLGGWAAEPARRFARALALGLLTLSVAANALGHGLEAYGLAPPWWVVVVVSAVAPAVLGAVVHLAVLVGRRPVDLPEVEESHNDVVDLDENGLSRWWETAQPVSEPTLTDRAQVLIAGGLGRRRLAKELGVTEHEARQLLEASRHTDSGDRIEEDAS